MAGSTSTSSDEESSSGEEELAQLMPLRIIDARIIGTEMGPEEKFRLCAPSPVHHRIFPHLASCLRRRYSIEVTTSRGSHVRQRRFREFVAVHNDIQATLAYPSLASPRKQLPDLAKATRKRMPSGLADLGELARSWSKDGEGVVKDRWAAPNARLVYFSHRCAADQGLRCRQDGRAQQLARDRDRADECAVHGGIREPSRARRALALPLPCRAPPPGSRSAQRRPG